MSEVSEEQAVRCMLLPFAGTGLLVPSTAVAEVIVVPVIDAAGDGPAWLGGFLGWRGVRLPLFDAAVALGLGQGQPERGRIAVLHTLQAGPLLQFYAIGIDRLPNVVLADESAVQPVERSEPVPWLHAEVRLPTGPALIPRFEVLEGMLRETVRDR